MEAAKKKPLNVALSRIPHPATIGMLALGEATGAKFNFIPYGGGNPTYTALLSGEADVGALPITGVLSLIDRFKVLTVFNKTNIFAGLTDNAPPVIRAAGAIMNGGPFSLRTGKQSNDHALVCVVVKPAA